MTGPENATKPPRRRWQKWMWVGLAIAIGLPTAGLVSLLVPRHGHFGKRGGVVTLVQAEREVPQGKFVSQSVQITTSTGLIVALKVLRPSTVGAPLPLVVLLGGHRTGREAVDVLGDPGPMVVAALDYPYHGPERVDGIAQSLGSIPAIQRALLDTPPAVLVALDWLSKQSWVDPKRVELMGLSLGVPFAAAAGALDSRFRRVWLIHGRVGNREWIANRLENQIESRFMRHGAAWILNLLAHGASFKTEYWVPQIAPRRVVVVGATDDEQMSRRNVEELFNAAAEPKEILWSKGGHVQPKRHEIVQQLLAMARSRIEGKETILTP